ncbi:MAG TPA: hypothetical protein VIY48_06775 [Candidatus Paceibacterota bacterium]
MDTQVETQVETPTVQPLKLDYDPLKLTVDQQACLLARRTAEILAEPAHWMKGDLARSERGHRVSAINNDAHSFCLLGGMERAAYELGILSQDPNLGPHFIDTVFANAIYDGRGAIGKVASAMLKVVQRLGARSILPPVRFIPDYNDYHATTHDDIVQVCRATALEVCVDLPGDECSKGE